MAETILAWNEALASIPESGLDEAYRRAFAERMRQDPRDKYPMKAVEMLAAWTNPSGDQAAEAARHAAELMKFGPARSTVWIVVRCEGCQRVGSVHPKAYRPEMLSPCCGEACSVVEG